MDELFPGFEKNSRRDKKGKDKKDGIGDFLKTHTNTNNLLGMFGGNTKEENKITDTNEDDPKGTKTSYKSKF